jgi:ATP adenylyltransferase
MSLEHLWAGWRNEYVSSVGSPGPAPAPDGDPAPLDDADHCVFCRIAASGPPTAGNGVLWVGRHVLAVLNAFPYSCGHLMVVPLRHVRSVGELTEEEGTELWSGLQRGVAALEASFGPDGINLGANLGRAAGAGIPRHLHLHAVPRWLGDTNFMTTVAGVRVLPETLADTWERLHGAWPPDRGG